MFLYRWSITKLKTWTFLTIAFSIHQIPNCKQKHQRNVNFNIPRYYDKVFTLVLSALNLLSQFYLSYSVIVICKSPQSIIRSDLFLKFNVNILSSLINIWHLNILYEQFIWLATLITIVCSQSA